MRKIKPKNYIDVVYDEKSIPLTSYPDKLTKYLYKKYEMHSGMKLLEAGCGRGEFLNGFIKCGVKGYGLDQYDNAVENCPNAEIKISNLERNKLPYPNNFFDVVFTKSVIEHLYYPERLITEIYRVLKPGGLIITMCPDWKYNYKIYYEDYTHRTPFTDISLRDIKLIHGFERISVLKFRQLPILWKLKFLILFSELTRIFSPNALKKFKWVKFSKEIMLLGSAFKPD